MQRRPRLITIPLLATSLATGLIGLTGCEDGSSDGAEGVTRISNEYDTILQSRPIIREERTTIDETAVELRRLATQADDLGQTGDANAAAILAANIRSAAGAFEADEAGRLESAAQVTRTLIRGLAGDAELLASSANAAESMDPSQATLVLETTLADARARIAEAEEQTSELIWKLEKARGERDSRIERASSLENKASERARIGVDAGPLDGLDDINESIDFRREARGHRIEAARNDISIETISPTMRVAAARQGGQNDIMNRAREARDGVADRRENNLAYAETLRRDVAELASSMLTSMKELERIESTEIIPRFQQAMNDFSGAADSARILTRGGSKAESSIGSRTISGAEFARGRVAWDAASARNRTADLVARILATGILADDAAMKANLESLIASRDEFLKDAAESMQKSLDALGNTGSRDDTDAFITQRVQQALEAINGADLVSMADAARKTREASRSTSGGGAASAGVASGGFGTPAALAKFLSTPAVDAKAMATYRSVVMADSATAQELAQIFTAQLDLMADLLPAMTDRFGADATIAAFENSGQGQSPFPTFTVESVDGDSARLANSTMSVLAAKGADGWHVDLDATLKNDPQIEMMVSMAGPMLKNMMRGLGEQFQLVTDEVKAGDFENASDVVAALEAKMSAAMGGMGGR
ncbi:MAG: hypothetical protein P8I44_00995 [Phycisphaerales bacterium]|nr:hypothetical protein [Phycisphaerales bacterium]MDG1977119.1 hypothetical protein [Phycisphaerales bacterium]